MRRCSKMIFPPVFAAKSRMKTNTARWHHGYTKPKSASAPPSPRAFQPSGSLARSAHCSHVRMRTDPRRPPSAEQRLSPSVVCNSYSKSHYLTPGERRRCSGKTIVSINGFQHHSNHHRTAQCRTALHARYNTAPRTKAVDKNGWGHVGTLLQSICLLAEERGLATCLQVNRPLK